MNRSAQFGSVRRTDLREANSSIMMGISQLIYEQKICNPLRGIQLNSKSSDLIRNEQIGSREIFEK